jgi:hypothetical protein
MTQKYVRLYADKPVLRNQMLDVLQTAAKTRKDRQNFVTDPCDPRWSTPEWVVFERGQMHAAVNAARAERGLPPVELKAIDRVERYAAGHVDYATKFALYCAEIALGIDDPRP